MNPSQTVKDLRQTFLKGKTKPVEYRVEQLKALKRMIEENIEELKKAVFEDLHKSRRAAAVEDMGLIGEIEKHLEHIHEWTAPQISTGKSSASQPGDFGYYSYEPFGVVLIMGAWNFPFYVTLSPFVGAIAAGMSSDFY